MMSLLNISTFFSLLISVGRISAIKKCSEQACSQRTEIPLISTLNAPLIAQLDISGLTTQIQSLIEKETEVRVKEEAQDLVKIIVQEHLKQAVDNLDFKLNNTLGKILEKEIIRPAFFATIRSHPFTLNGIDDVVKFDHVKLNRGDGYDPNTGIFVAPRSGIYQFSIMILGNHNHVVNYQLNKNTEAYVLGYSKMGLADSSTISAVVNMKKGDKVFVKHRVQGVEQIYGADHSSFSGVFVMQ